MSFDQLVAEASAASHYPEAHRAEHLAELHRQAGVQGHHHFFRRPAPRAPHSEFEAPPPFDVRLV
jgi:hypothetical protein